MAPLDPTAGPREYSPWAPVLLAGCIAVAYANSLGGPFVFDDVPSIVENPSVLSLGTWLHHPLADGGITISGRPALSLTFALNHLWSGTDVGGYRVTNLLIHIGNALLLFGLVRRTLGLSATSWRLRAARTPLAWFTALLWGLHPLATAAVTYVVQRAESLMALCFLVTLYATVRSEETPGTRRWPGLALAACAVGMAVKEVMAVAPLVVALFDRAFLAGTCRDVWRRRGGMYSGLAASCFLAILLAFATAGRGGTVGWGTPVTVLPYLQIQGAAVLGYLGRALWPGALIFDYGTAESFGHPGLISATVVGALLIASVLIFLRWPKLGFFGVAFFAILAPTSSFMPIASQVAAEHRMYLPLAGVVALGVVMAFWIGGRFAWAVFALAALALGLQTVERNATYRTTAGLWQDVVNKWPTNARAHYNLALALARENREGDAIDHYRAVVRLQPTDADAFNKLGAALLRVGQTTAASEALSTALRLQPSYLDAENNLAIALLRSGNSAEGIAHLATVAKSRPESFETQVNLGMALAQAGRVTEALQALERARALRPDDPQLQRMLTQLRLSSTLGS